MWLPLRSRKMLLLFGAPFTVLANPQRAPNFVLPISLPVPSADPYPHAPILNQPPSFRNSLTLQPIPTSLVDSTSPHHLKLRDVIGTDDREHWSSTAYPYSSMGRLEILTLDSRGIPLTRKLCSSTLIGPRHVATAAHCVLHPASPSSGQQKIRFQPSFDICENRNPAIQDNYGGSFTTYIYAAEFSLQGNTCAAYSDVAVLIIQERLGDTLGFLDVAMLNSETDLSQPVFNSFGYPQDKGGGERPVRQRGISVVKPPGGCGEGNPISTNADIGLGMSGGPMWRGDMGSNGRAVVYGVLSSGGTNDGEKISTFSGGRLLLDYAGRARREFPWISILVLWAKNLGIW